MDAEAAKRVLIADDNRDAADALAVVLRFFGYETATAYDGLEAVVQAEGFEPGVAILDIHMPAMDGYEAARRIRARAGEARVVLVALTAVAGATAIARAEEAGFDAFLRKPVDGDDLLRFLRSLE